MTKVRVIRALKDVDLIRIDRAPTYFKQPDIALTKLFPIPQDCFSMPGVALRKGEYYHVVLGPDQIFKAKEDYTYFISYKLRLSLNVLHDNDSEDFVQFEKPFGTEKFVAEVHFPPTRKLTKVNNKVQPAVYAVRSSNLEEIGSTNFTVNAADPIEPIPGTFTDMFRLTLLDPPQDADYIRITWKWSIVE